MMHVIQHNLFTEMKSFYLNKNTFELLIGSFQVIINDYNIENSRFLTCKGENDKGINVFSQAQLIY